MLCLYRAYSYPSNQKRIEIPLSLRVNAQNIGVGERESLRGRDGIGPKMYSGQNILIACFSVNMM